jgi:multiple sugar transport system substrate-binding protein
LKPKTLSTLSVLIAVIFLLTACGDAATPTATPPAGSTDATAAATSVPSGDKTQVTLTTWAGADEAKELQAVIDKVNASATDFQIVHQANPADYYTKIQTMIAGNTAPDLMWLSQEYIANYADNGAILDLTDLVGKMSDMPAAKLDDYYPGTLEVTRYNDRLYGLPWIAAPVMLYYNVDMFQKAGINPPDESWTWDTFKDAAQKLTLKDASGNVTQYGTSFNGWPPVHMFIWQAGGEVISEDLKTSPIDSPEAVQGAQFYKDIIYNAQYAVPETVITEQGFGEMVKAGKVAMFFGGAADDLDYAHAKDPKNANLKIALVPKGPKSRTTFAYTAVTVASARTANPDITTKALLALTDGIHHWKVLAPRKSLATVDVIAASVPGKKESAPVIIQAAEDMRGFRNVPKQTEWDTIFWEQFQDPLYHDKGTAADLAKSTRPKLEEVLPK